MQYQGSERQDDERLCTGDGGGDASRESLGGEEEQREEGADVERSERERLPPPGAVGEPKTDEDGEQPRGE